MPAKIDVHAFHRHGILPVFAVMKNIILIFQFLKEKGCLVRLIT